MLWEAYPIMAIYTPTLICMAQVAPKTSNIPASDPDLKRGHSC